MKTVSAPELAAAAHLPVVHSVASACCMRANDVYNDSIVLVQTCVSDLSGDSREAKVDVDAQQCRLSVRIPGYLLILHADLLLQRLHKLLILRVF